MSLHWDLLISRGEGAIRDLIGTQESLTLEFKANHPRNPIFQAGILTDHGRRVIARELSAFSNSAGGVLILGIDCRTVDQIDEARELVPIEEIGRAESSIKSAVSELLQPVHDGIDVLAIRRADSDTGYIAISVPRSDRRPHRSEAKGQKEYFRRSGTAAIPMEHYDIEDAFRRTSAPLLSLHLDFKWKMKNGEGKFDMGVMLGLSNEGEVTAKSVSMQLWAISGLLFTTNTGIARSEFAGRHLLAAPTDFVVHPGDVRKFAELHFIMNRAPSGLLDIDGIILNPDFLGFDYSIGAEGMRRRSGRIQIGERELTQIRKVTE